MYFILIINALCYSNLDALCLICSDTQNIRICDQQAKTWHIYTQITYVQKSALFYDKQILQTR